MGVEVELTLVLDTPATEELLAMEPEIETENALATLTLESTTQTSTHKVIPTIPAKETRLDPNNNYASPSSLSSLAGDCDPREFRNSPVLGNYAVAAHSIESGQIIAVDSPLVAAAYGPSSGMPYCLSCYKDIALSVRCTKCRWPICDSVCETAPQHANNECSILAASKARPRHKNLDYTALEAMRCLLLRDREPAKWEQILRLEPHSDAREKCPDATEVTKYVKNFILNRCKLGDRFTEQEVNHVLGAISVNTFSGFCYIERNVSLLFPPSVSFIAHDCNPNLLKTILLRNTANKDANAGPINNSETNPRISPVDPSNEEYAIQLVSTRHIPAGETLSINYVDTALGVIERRFQLRDSFYFYCDCLRCRVELFDELASDSESLFV